MREGTIMKKFEEFFGGFLERFEIYFEEAVGRGDEIKEMMLYSLFPGGKRFRPLLVYSAAYPVENEKVYAAAAAVEFAHNSSLVHDDLPGVDNAEERRGKPAVHKKFGVANAIMIGDALLAKAFEMASFVGEKAVYLLAKAMGEKGIAGGQIMDVRGVSDLEEIYELYQRKTAALIKVSLKLGFLTAGREELMEKAEELGQEIGFLFQILDDVKDWKEELNEPNIVNLVGKEKALKLADQHYQRAKEILDKIDRKERIEFLLDYIYGMMK